MKKMMVGLAGAALLLSACGGGSVGGGTGGGPTGGGNTGGGPSAGTTLTRAKLQSCASSSGSADPVAANCLVGTVVGVTLSGKTCKLVITANSGYQYSTDGLNFSNTIKPTDDVYFSKDSSYTLIIWTVTSINSKIKSIEFKYGFSDNNKVEINAEDNDVKSTCTAQL